MNTISKTLGGGVEYKKLGEVCKFYTGIQLNKTDMLEMGQYPVINGGTKPSGYTDQYNENKDTITISQGGASAGYINFITTNFWAGAHCYVIKPNEEVILNRFLYFVLKSQEINIQNSKRGAGIPGLNKSDVGNIPIPLPPIPVQEEIVRILDTLTNLQTNLQTELELRKKQYQYYRDKLLSFEDIDGGGGLVELSKIAKISRGKRVTKKQLTDGGIYPVYQNSLTPMGYYDKCNSQANTTYVISAGSAGEIGYSNIDFWAADDCFIFSDLKGVINKYIYYFLLTKQNLINSNVWRAGIPRLSRTVIEKLEIPLPPLEEQKRIVGILDRFDKLVNDISEGIPAEIQMRKKQYEYYRDRLLRFEAG